MTVLAVSGLTVRYGAVTALSALSLDVAAGEIVCLVGSNGAGKSSMLKGVIGIQASSGLVSIEGRALEGLPSHERVAAGVSLVPEGRHVFPTMTVAENLRIGCRSRDDALARRRSEEVLAIFPRLEERLDQQAGTMSGGEQQMLAIGRALMAAPRVLLLDEPTLGLSPSMVDRVGEVLLTLRERKLAILLAEQNLTMALSVADRGVVLERGSVVASGPAAEMREDPAVRRAYLG
jgi:branched-chain amino acid transport system ATP-binding protein